MAAEERKAFLFPNTMDGPTAHAMLAEAYAKVNASKIVRRTTKRARREGLDPDGDVVYVAEPKVAQYPDGKGIQLGSDILLHEPFEGWQRCLQIFEEEVGQAVLSRLEKLVARWKSQRR